MDPGRWAGQRIGPGILQELNPFILPEQKIIYQQSPIYVVSLVKNQVSPARSTYDPSELAGTLKSKAQMITCPYCQAYDKTRVEHSCNCCNLCCCCFCCCWWFIYQLEKRKDMNCLDANHYCRDCDQLIYRYSAC